VIGYAVICRIILTLAIAIVTCTTASVLKSKVVVVAVAKLQRVSRLEGIIPALETSYAIAYLETLCSQLSGSPRILINCSGRGDKDVHTVAQFLTPQS
jgi:tryptophan synthase beta subunit